MLSSNRSVNQANNRYAANQGVSYDAAGNVTSGVGGHSFAYDGENRQTSYDNGAATYSYDGDGRRVKKVTGIVTTVFVYDAGGQLVAEYSSSSSQESGGTSYLTADTLGTPRVITDSSGAVKARHDYLPFGEEITAGVGGRTAGQGCVVDDVRQKFTKYERDVETGLDYAQARYYSSTQGRFTSPDPLPASAVISNPQSFNRYTYTLNNPLRYVDPLGLDAQNPWEGLDDKTRRLLAPKLTSVANSSSITDEELSAAGKAFADKVKVYNNGVLDVDATNTKIGTVQNFVDSLGSDPQVWNQVKSIGDIHLQGNGRQGDLDFTVFNGNKFEAALANTKDAQDYYRFTNITNSEAYRERGYSVNDPSMHITRDARYANGYYTHWDPTTAFTKATPGNIALDATLFAINPALPVARHVQGATGHIGAPRPTLEQVRGSLREQGLVPRQ
jgi:RHS repeat-associated protein